MRRLVTVLAAALISVWVQPTAGAAQIDVYSSPGQHTVNGRQWRTWCERYSRTARCHTDIWSARVVYRNGTFQKQEGWVFNNLTYLSSPESLWKGNPLATPGEHRLDGRRWRTECHTRVTGNGCRSYIWSTTVRATPQRNGGHSYSLQETWVLNNIVQFGPLRRDIASLVTWRPGHKPSRQPGPAIPDAAYNLRKGPNTTNRVTLTYDDCPTSLNSFKATVEGAKRLGISLALFPTGQCLKSGRFDAAFARRHGHYVFNHSVNHPNLTKLSENAVVRELGRPGVVTTYGRPPYTDFNATTKRAYARVGMRIWTWTLNTFDYKGKSSKQLVNQVVKEARPGDAVLMHMQWHGFNEPTLRAMRDGLAKRGIQVCRSYPGTTPVAPSAMRC